MRPEIGSEDVSEMADGSASGQAQKADGGDGALSRQRSQMQPTPVRLPRLRRCPCCLKWKRQPGEFVRYRIIDGAAVLSSTYHLTTPSRITSRGEIERVTMVPEGKSYAYRYEVIRGGRWVSWWEGLYGRHKDESKLAVRRNSDAR